jgi:biotin operon repressor
MPLTSFPNSNHQTAVNTHATTVLRGLQARDQSNPITGKQIGNALSIPEPAVRAIVHHLREAGHPIGSSGKGYWYAGSPTELAPTITHLEQRIRSMAAAADGLRRAFNG